MPVSGNATYVGPILGTSTETAFDPYESAAWLSGRIQGTIDLSFNFGSGALSGTINPSLGVNYTLPSLSFTDTVYSTGSPMFSGRFATTLTGFNSFSGLFTGPSGQELIGNFAFPYLSPIDGANSQAAGAFVARRP